MKGISSQGDLHAQAQLRTLLVDFLTFIEFAPVEGVFDLYRDVIFLDIALEAATRGVIESSLSGVKTAASAGTCCCGPSASCLRPPTCSSLGDQADNSTCSHMGAVHRNAHLPQM